MTKRTKVIIGIVVGVLIVGIAAVLVLGKVGIINLGIFADIVSRGDKSYTYNVTTDASQGKVFASQSEKDP